MKNEEYGERAAALFAEGYNCCQAVAAAFADEAGQPRDLMLRVSCPFGGGFARTHNICGAVSGMGIVAGLVYGSDDPRCKLDMYPRVQALCGKFKEQFGSVVCAELLQIQSTAAQRGLRRKTCADCVRTAAEILAEDLRNNEHI